MKVWIITDTHWHQDGERIDRPVDHTQRSIASWKKMVGAEDLVIHTGDVTWNDKSLLEDLTYLPGRKVLVRGNHDSNSLPWYMNHGFHFACDSFVFKKVLFTHAPANNLPGDALLNVHGHLHLNKQYVAQQPFHRLLALEKTKYQPVSFDKFVGKLPVIDLV